MILEANIEIVHRLYQTGKGSFKEMLFQLMALYEAVYTPVRIVVFGAPQNNEEYCERFSQIRNVIAERFGNTAPTVSYVAQPPCPQGLVMEVHEVVLTDADRICYKTLDDVPYITVEREGCKRLFMSGIIGNVLQATIRRQADDVFRTISHIMIAEQMPVSSIVRQWNYIEKITDCDVTGHQHYQDFNDARSLFYQSAQWLDGYPAATGIGTQWGGVMIDIDALFCQDKTVCVKAVDNPLQVSAHAYSQNVLLGEKDEKLNKKTTPKFERAKAIWKKDHGFVYISGTAAIRGEQSLEGVGIEEQTLATLENIKYLVSAENLGESGIPVTKDASYICFRVYVKRWEDMAKAREVITRQYPDLPAVYTLTDVCRSELLIEMEGVGVI